MDNSVWVLSANKEVLDFSGNYYFTKAEARLAALRYAEKNRNKRIFIYKMEDSYKFFGDDNIAAKIIYDAESAAVDDAIRQLSEVLGADFNSGKK